jgi:hypothetical protein
MKAETGNLSHTLTALLLQVSPLKFLPFPPFSLPPFLLLAFRLSLFPIKTPMMIDRLLKPPFVLVLGGGALLILSALLFLTWRGVGEESHATPVPSSAPVARSTPIAPREQVTAPVAENFPVETSSKSPVVESSPVPVETPDLIPYQPSAPVPAVFGAAGNPLVTKIPYAPGLEDIANDFIEKVKQGGWDTTSEAYQKNWQKAVEEADNLVRARYGTEVYLRLKQEAAP